MTEASALPVFTVKNLRTGGLGILLTDGASEAACNFSRWKTPPALDGVAVRRYQFSRWNAVRTLLCPAQATKKPP